MGRRDARADVGRAITEVPVVAGDRADPGVGLGPIWVDDDVEAAGDDREGGVGRAAARRRGAARTADRGHEDGRRGGCRHLEVAPEEVGDQRGQEAERLTCSDGQRVTGTRPTGGSRTCHRRPERAGARRGERIEGRLTLTLGVLLLNGAGLHTDRICGLGRAVGGRLACRVADLDVREEQPAEVDRHEQQEQEYRNEERELHHGLTTGRRRSPAAVMGGCERMRGAPRRTRVV